MRKRYSYLLAAALAAVAVLLVHGAESAAVRQSRLQQHRNLGKAHYESPTGSTAAVEEFRLALALAPDSFRDRLNYGLALLKAGQVKEGVEELRKAQAQNPEIPHSWFNLGIAYKRETRYAEAVTQLEQMVRLVPNEPISRYNLGHLYNLTGKPELAIEQFEQARRLDPKLVAPIFQLYNIYRLAGNQQEAARALADFQEARNLQKQFDESEDMEWSYYSEIYEPPEPRSSIELSGQAPELRFQAQKLEGMFDPTDAGLAVTDADGDSRPDLVAWSRSELRLYRGGTTLVPEAFPAGLGNVISVAPADFDNDGLLDLCVLTNTGPVLLRNLKTRYQQAGVKLPAGRFEKASWLDFDHDYDLDLFLLGNRCFLIRNEGQSGFSDRTSTFPFVQGSAIDGTVARASADGKGWDLAVSYTDRGGVLYRDMLRGRYEAQPLDLLPARAASLGAYDVNNDGWLDLAYSLPGQVVVLMNRQGKFEVSRTPASAAGDFLFTDLANRTVGDLVTGDGVRLNIGAGRFGEVSRSPGFSRSVALADADFDLDGRTDLAAVAADGSLSLWRNVAKSGSQWLRVTLNGARNLRLSPGAEVEVKAGLQYQKRAYEGLPLTFGMGLLKQADTVRITWANGLIQNEVKQPSGKSLIYKEAPKLSGSCPMVYTWNGERFRFLADVLGVAPLGASSGDGKYFPVDHDEYLQIAPEDLALTNGRYEIRIAEELHEVSYLDQVRLFALDHPADTEIVTNDKFKSPPFPEFRLYGVRRRTYPVAASDGRGQDVLPRILRRDRTYPDSFRRDLRGVAETHSLELDFGAKAARGNRAVLVLHGWIDWADGSTFLAQAQEGKGGLMLPYLQVQDENGRWKTVLEDMGVPAGAPRTIAVDLTGKFISPSRKIRIVTNTCVYWDEVFLTEDTGEPQVGLTGVEPEVAGLRFRGFSWPIIDAERRQPESYDYSRLLAATSWNPVPGLYTRYGSVRELLLAEDDRLVVMGSGDELRLQFDSRGLPALPLGWKREFLFLVDGWSKDADANTAHSESVEPLPFHGMSSYPYPPGEHFPDSPAHRAYRRMYNTRREVPVMPPLAQSRRFD